MRALIGLTLLILFAVGFFCRAARAEAGAPDLSKLPANTWVKLHEQKRGDALVFERQAHGGSCFDSKRGRLILFGSNTHGKKWQNNPFFFDPLKLQWTKPCDEDPFATYTVTDAGLPVAGKDGTRPWATHTFGAVVYDASRDEMIAACFDDHLQPGRFSDVMKDLWPKIKLKPTWVYSCETGLWRAIPQGQSFFAHCAAYDSDRKTALGYRADGVYELAGDGETRAWSKVSGPVKELTGWHTQCAYDSKNKALVVFGHHQDKNDIGVYFTETKEAKLMPTAGARPPKDQHTPMEFHPKLGQTVVLVDRTKKKDNAEADSAETWLYDLVADSWTQVKTATLPFACAMNYNMEYDPQHNVMLLVTGEYSPVIVWALRLE
jgi:hypothetical protein